MCKICPKCGSIAEYSAYYGRTICTTCSWESDKRTGHVSYVRGNSKITKEKCRVNKGDLLKV